MTWTIVPMNRPEQIDTVLAIEERAFTSPWTREMYLAELENAGVSFCYLAPDPNGRAVGFCSFWKVTDELHINNLAVLPEFRRAGVATALLTYVLAEGARLGARRATLERSGASAVRTFRLHGGGRPLRLLHETGRGRSGFVAGIADLKPPLISATFATAEDDQGGGV